MLILSSAGTEIGRGQEMLVPANDLMSPGWVCSQTPDSRLQSPVSSLQAGMYREVGGMQRTWSKKELICGPVLGTW